MHILGISAFYHDSAAALIHDGEILAAAQEERFTRRKHDANFPTNAIRYCLESSGLKINEIDFFAFYDKPFLKFERLLETYLAFAPRGLKGFAKGMPVWLQEKLFQKRLLQEELEQLGPISDFASKMLFTEHHQAHAASAFFPSPFQDAAVLTLDGVGEWATTSLCIGHDNQLDLLREIHFPHSLGLLYSAFTYYTGFKVNSGEYKVMGLAPYGTPRFTKQIYNHLIDVKADGSFRLNMEYFDYCVGETMTNRKFDQLFGGPARSPETPLTQTQMDLAASIQNVCEEVMLKLARSIARETQQKNLCLAGGVALNCVANGKILRAGLFENIWIQPAAGDAGGSLGAALAAYHLFCNHPRAKTSGLDAMKGAYLGPEFTQDDIERRLDGMGAKYRVLPTEQLTGAAAQALSQSQAIGWFEGRMEFGPRALGARSILGDPRSPTTQKNLNLKVKFRESFRPFAPSVMSEHVADWFELDAPSPYMLLVAEMKRAKRHEMSPTQRALFGIDKLNVVRSNIPAVTHVDYSARIQTVHKETNPAYHALLAKFHALTGCPALVNTSFNVRGEPIVCTPEDAYRCFMGTGLDALAIGNCWLEKTVQPTELQKSYANKFAKD